jgi:hypothetical protein
VLQQAVINLPFRVANTIKTVRYRLKRKSNFLVDQNPRTFGVAPPARLAIVLII